MNNKKPIFTNEIIVRIDDINYGNHLCHSRLVNLIHHSRALWLKSLNLSEINCFNYGMVMLHMDLRYKSQCNFDDVLLIQSFVDKLDKIKVSFCYKIYNKTTDKLAAQVIAEMGFIDQNKKLSNVPEQFAKLL